MSCTCDAFCDEPCPKHPCVCPHRPCLSCAPAVDTEAAAVWDRGEQRTLRADDGRAIGFIRLTKGGLWRAYSYRAGVGCGPFESEPAARAWLAEHDRPIAGYSR